MLGLLVERYEEEHFPIDPPDPIDAIRFRMDQMGLRNKDLVPYIGSASRVSEVLNRKLTAGPGIPAAVLIRDPDRPEADETELGCEGFPLSEMRRRSYFDGSLHELREYCSERVTKYLNSVPERMRLEPALLRTTAHVRSSDKTTDPFSLWAWQVRVLQIAYDQRLPCRSQPGTVTPEWL